MGLLVPLGQAQLLVCELVAPVLVDPPLKRVPWHANEARAVSLGFVQCANASQRLSARW